MSRSEQISQFITDNIRDPEVINKANEKFKFDDKEVDAMKVVDASLVAINAQLTVLDCWRDIAEAGREILGDES